MPRSNISLGGQEFKLDADADTSVTADTDDRIDFKTGGTDRLQVQSTSGNNVVIADGLTLTDGNVAVANGHGLSFAATSDGGVSTPSELLDDYEEGTWTAQLTDGSTDVALSTSAVYTKIGNLVTVSFDKYNVSISSLSTSDLSIKTLPFASNANSHGNKIIHVTGTSSGANTPVLVYPVSSSTSLALYKAVSSSQNMAQLTTSDLSSSISIRLTLTYFTDS